MSDDDPKPAESTEKPAGNREIEDFFIAFRPTSVGPSRIQMR